jgi:large subunit ribosomal protein L13
MKTLTSFIRPSSHRKKWYIFDCKMYQSVSFGRIAPTIVQKLIGKDNSFYDPSTNVGNYVILINAEYIKFDQEVERLHVFHPGHPGNSLKRLTKITPQRIIETCIFNMLPNGVTKKHLRKQLKIYQGNQHPHTPYPLREIRTGGVGHGRLIKIEKLKLKLKEKQLPIKTYTPDF